MTWSDTTLMAYADGELDAAQRAELERALAGDAALRARVAAFRTQRSRVAAAFDAVLDEPVPERLAQSLQPPAVAPVADLSTARARRDARRAGLPTWARTRARTWAQWGGIAAGVLVGVLLGGVGRDGTDTALVLRDGRLVAAGALAGALSVQLASEPVAGAAVAVQLSFVDRAGAYCRTFSTAALAGLACRQGEAWAVQTVAAADAAPAGAVRQAASALPHAVLDAVDERIGGSALDAAAERQARDRGWRR